MVNNMIFSGINDDGTHNRRLLINENCKWVIDDYKYSIVDENGMKVDSGDRGHMSDAVDYWVYRMEKGSSTFTYVW